MISHRKRQIKNKEEVNRKKISGEKNGGVFIISEEAGKKIESL